MKSWRLASGGGGELDAKLGYAIETTDQYVDVRAGRSVELLRAYHRLDVWADVYWNGGDGGFLPLQGIEGATVRFLWNPNSNDYDVRTEGNVRDEGFLSILSEDLDYKTLLPSSDVFVGDEWTLDGLALLPLLLPGIDPEKLHAKDWVADGYPKEDGEVFATEFRRFLESVEVHCVYEGDQAKDDERLARILLDCRIEGAIVPFAKMRASQGDPDPLRFELALSINGLLRWNLDRHIFHSLDLRGEGEVTQCFFMAFAKEMQMESRWVFSGEVAWRASASVE